jgi:hypothetical protein
VRGLSLVVDDERLPELTGPLFDGLYALKKRSSPAEDGDGTPAESVPSFPHALERT